MYNLEYFAMENHIKETIFSAFFELFIIYIFSSHYVIIMVLFEEGEKGWILIMYLLKINKQPI